MVDYLKNRTIETLTNFGFLLVHDGGELVYMDSPKENEFKLPVVQAILYIDATGGWSIDLEGKFKSPVIGNECVFIDYLERYFPGWH